MRQTTIILKGHLDKKWKSWFENMHIAYNENTTELTGSIPDNAMLHGILNKIRDLNLDLISLHRSSLSD